jgi:exopolysaccharide biosynthesis polyprenyl glycosylphosphotransferase
MTNLRRKLPLVILGLSDLVLLGISLYIAIFGRATLKSLARMGQATVHVHTMFAIVILFFAWKSALSLIGIYQSKRLTRRLYEIADLLRASAIAAVLLEIVVVIFGAHAVTLAIVVRFWLLAACSLIALRLSMRLLLSFARRHGRNLRNVIIVGTNDRALVFSRDVIGRPELGYRLVGFVDDVWFGPPPGSEMNTALVSNIAGFRSYLRAHVIDEVVIALPIKSFYEREAELLEICREQGVIARVLSDLFHADASVTVIDQLHISPTVSFYNSPTNQLELAAKRVVDVAVSILLLVLLSPVMLAALLLVKLDSEGPAIFVQERIGLNKRRFRMFKFRSMLADAEKLQTTLETHNEMEGPVFKIKQDPRITRVGRFLRKTSIDELPQLFNVLKGDMSLVGPRPLPVRDYSGFNEDRHRRRFSVRPGITCLWQVSGRSSISFDQWMRLDVEYIDRWSLWLDLKILAMTIPAVVKGSGAS